MLHAQTNGMSPTARAGVGASLSSAIAAAALAGGGDALRARVLSLLLAALPCAAASADGADATTHTPAAAVAADAAEGMEASVGGPRSSDGAAARLRVRTASPELAPVRWQPCSRCQCRSSRRACVR